MQLEDQLLNRLRLREGWGSLVLLVLLMLIMAWTFGASGLEDGLQVMPIGVLAGTLFGFALAKSRMPALLAQTLGVATGAATSLLLVSTIVHAPPTAGALLTDLQTRALIVLEHLERFVWAARQGGVSSDPLPFVAQMVALGWMLAFCGAWFLYRSHWVWGAVLPGGVATLLGVYYAPPRLLIYFVLYLLVSLVLVVRAHVYLRERDWERHGVVYDRHIGLSFLRDGLLVSLAVICAVWLLPHPTPSARLGDYWDRLRSPWQQVQDEWNRLYAAISYREQASAARFARSVVLGGAINLSTTPVMEVHSPAPQYWRAVVLDRYTGTGWEDSSRHSVAMSSQAALTYWAAYRTRQVLQQEVTLLRPQDGLLLAAGEPLQADVAVRATCSVTLAAGQPPSDASFEVSALYAPSLIRSGCYVVRSLVSQASVQQLRAASVQYPAWILERYRDQPTTVPPRLGLLARQIAAGGTNAYDRAAAFERYLRTFRYNQAIDAPPAGRDPVDWFLFETQEGYCTYFASAMVLLCRSVGIPARYVQGYATGEYLSDRGVYLVREADAHAWPEVFFPDYGWIAFEPTPSHPLISRPSREDQSALGLGLGGDQPGRADEERFGADVPLPPLGGTEDVRLPMADRGLGGWLVIGAGAGLLLLLLGALGWRWWQRWRMLRPAAQLYARLTWLAAPLGLTVEAHQTPLEYGRALAGALQVDGADLRALVTLYLRERFGRFAPSREELAAAEVVWRRIRCRAVRRALGRLRPRLWTQHWSRQEMRTE
ncbi:MAG: DUF4129 domain-containing transglutaminase family protein [Anaerolineae bacterium]